MTLYTSSTLGVNWRWALDDLLMTLDEERERYYQERYAKD